MAMQLVLFVEQQLGVRLDNDDLDFEEFPIRRLGQSVHDE